MQPITLCAYEVDVSPVFDAQSEGQRQALGVRGSDLACPSWEERMLTGGVPTSQALADRLIAEGYTGMVVHSFANRASANDLNLVLWKWGSDLPVKVDLIEDEARLSRQVSPFR